MEAKIVMQKAEERIRIPIFFISGGVTDNSQRSSIKDAEIAFV
ncbi:hypothetical protein Epro_0187 [Endomicrobium proavitum]|uniref:Uncharacterized protein n=1 Tax=Endomicrobium proavitum TaxID=1408281 RepID=A0A0G3WG17_9BACT|nr:hypothetical protein Epro_0187 [Endomicrobium proavitum]